GTWRLYLRLLLPSLAELARVVVPERVDSDEAERRSRHHDHGPDRGQRARPDGWLAADQGWQAQHLADGRHDRARAGGSGRRGTDLAAHLALVPAWRERLRQRVRWRLAGARRARARFHDLAGDPGDAGKADPGDVFRRAAADVH